MQVNCFFFIIIIIITINILFLRISQFFEEKLQVRQLFGP